MAQFGPIAPFYDQLMHSVPYDMWLEYYLLLLETRDQRPERILDVCCGTGLLCEMMAKRGYDISGIDISAPMIDEAKRKATELDLQIAYLAQSAQDFRFEQPFESAYSFFDSLNYITDLGELKKAIQNVSDHLLPGSMFVFDLNTEYAFTQKMFDQHDTRKKAQVKYDWKGDYDTRSRVIKVHMDFWVDGEHYVETHIQRAHTRDEMFELLIEADFDEITVFDSYTLDPPRKASDRVHYRAMKAE